MDPGVVEGEAEGNNDQIRKPRRDERSKRSEKQTTGRITRRITRRRNGFWFATTAEARDTQRDCPRHLQIKVPKLLTKGDTDEESSEVMCAGSSGNVNSTVLATKTMTSWEWNGRTQNKASGSVSQLRWTRANLKRLTSRRLQSCGTSQLAGLKHALGFVEAERKFKVRPTDGPVDVESSLISTAKMVAAGKSCAIRQQGHQDCQTKV